MNNKQKLEQTVEVIRNLQKEYLPSLEDELKTAISNKDSNKANRLEEKILKVKGLEFIKEKETVQYQSCKYGRYVQMIRNSKKRVKAVPICFFVTLYELELAESLKKEDISIPYTLRGFWNMKRADELLQDLLLLQKEQEAILAWELRKMRNQFSKRKDAKKEAYNNLLEEVEALSFMRKGAKELISYEKENLKFTFNKRNLKLDVVPLCKILTLYYFNVCHWLQEAGRYGVQYERLNLHQIRESFDDFMKKYFVDKVIL